MPEQVLPPALDDDPTAHRNVGSAGTVVDSKIDRITMASAVSVDVQVVAAPLAEKRV